MQTQFLCRHVSPREWNAFIELLHAMGKLHWLEVADVRDNNATVTFTAAGVDALHDLRALDKKLGPLGQMKARLLFDLACGRFPGRKL